MTGDSQVYSGGSATDKTVASKDDTTVSKLKNEEPKDTESKDSSPAPQPSASINDKDTSNTNANTNDNVGNSAAGAEESSELTGETSTTHQDAAKCECAPKSGAKVETTSGEGWNDTDFRFCPRNGKPHASLVDFNYRLICPECSMVIRTKHISGPIDSLSDRGDGKISYSVEYRDSGNNTLGNVPWDGPFDLAVARKNIAMKQSAFGVVTVLGTSLPADNRRFSSEIDRIMKAGIIDNWRISVNVRTTLIVIHSNSLINAIASVLSYYPSMKLGNIFVEGGRKSVELAEPYAVIAHHLEELEAHRASYTEDSTGDSPSKSTAASNATSVSPRCGKETFEHLGMLLDFVKEFIFKDRIEVEKARYTKGLCVFSMLWLLYKPGSTVYLESKGQYSAYVVQSVEIDEAVLSTTQGQSSPYTVKVWNLDFDGYYVGRSATSVTIPYFDGEREITSLRLIPCEFIDKKDDGKTRARLREQGKRWYELLQGGQVFYSGEFLGESKRKYEGRVYVDSKSYYSQFPKNAPEICNTDDMGEGLARCPCEDCHGRRPHPPVGFRWSSYDLLDPLVDKDLDEAETGGEDAGHRYLLCSSALYGFVLKSRTWEELHVTNCYEAKVNETAIDTLVMPDERKDMIKALVQKFTGVGYKGSSRSWGADFMENKGEGQIFLLHGSPGVGKTYTAECIAEYTGRALLSLTCGDIGTDEVQMEEQLSKWFRLAEKWGAVILIDEADVYLEKRQMTDLKRNSLVSVFLRCIEYYRGILFLTTNRVGHFDDAFISRIHVIIRYNNLNQEDRKKIWNQFFNKLSDEREDFIITGRAKAYVLEDETISKLEWNGREIRNAFQTAVALAEYRFSQKANKSKQDLGPTLDQKDFEQVCDMTRQFKQYLTDIHGIDEEERAFQAKARTGHNQSRLGTY
ncbi:hypothetical protein F4774DRAFT_138082 [Daldinia eschscholtzii]|nr:hypothetical protein F4774DRAFT_138082 [Daldinia eschscholtzii]